MRIGRWRPETNSPVRRVTIVELVTALPAAESAEVVEMRVQQPFLLAESRRSLAPAVQPPARCSRTLRRHSRAVRMRMLFAAHVRQRVLVSLRPAPVDRRIADRHHAIAPPSDAPPGQRGKHERSERAGGHVRVAEEGRLADLRCSTCPSTSVANASSAAIAGEPQEHVARAEAPASPSMNRRLTRPISAIDWFAAGLRPATPGRSPSASARAAAETDRRSGGALTFRSR